LILVVILEAGDNIVSASKIFKKGNRGDIAAGFLFI